jgi:hypothetical protein
VYYIGKLLLAQGLDIMLELEDYYKQCTNKYFAVIFTEAGQIKNITKAFHGRRRLARKLPAVQQATPMVVQNEYHENSPFVGRWHHRRQFLDGTYGFC